VFGFWRPGGVDAPPTKEGRGEGEEFYLCNLRRRRRRGMKISVVGEGGE